MYGAGFFDGARSELRHRGASRSSLERVPRSGTSRETFFIRFLGGIIPAHFYILRLRSGGLYTGSSRNLDKRVKEHFAGTGSRTTRLDPPVSLAYSESFDSYREAFRREQQVKSWSRAKKEALIRGEMAGLKRLSQCHVK
ncbi:MAG: GIY-YIG nuclease family protein [Bacteroidota bacterium]